MDSLLFTSNHNRLLEGNHILGFPASLASAQETQNMRSVSHCLTLRNRHGLYGAIQSQYFGRKIEWFFMRVALHRALQYIVIDLFIDWNEQDFHMTLFASCMGQITIVLLCSEGTCLDLNARRTSCVVQLCCWNSFHSPALKKFFDCALI